MRFPSFSHTLTDWCRTGGLALVAAVLSAAFLLTACDTRFEDINTNPNEPSEVRPGLLLPDILRSSVNTSVNTAHSTGNLVLQYTAKVSFNTDIDRYNWDAVGYWNPLYEDLRNVETMIRTARDRGDQNYEAIGLILKSWIYSMLTDAYGTVPYTEAMSVLEGEETPAYTPQPEIYRGLLDDLEQANTLIDPSAGAVDGDILYGGEQALMRWKRLANSLRLRLLMRLSEKQGQIDGVDVDGDFASIVSSSEAPVFVSDDDNAGLQYLSSRPNEWPIHTDRIGSFRTFRMSKTLTDTLLAHDDPRLPVFADTTNAPDTTAAGLDDGSPEYVGVPNGLTDDRSSTFNGGPSYQSSLNTNRYFTQPNAAEGLIMTYAEVEFLRAEAAARGWTSEDAQAQYRDGIEASMAQYGRSMPNGYMNQPGIAYPTGDSQEGIDRINKQKWIALFYTGMEGWFNWRRTGIPDIEPSRQNVNQDQIPVRFRYPESEQSLNGTSYDEAINRQGPDNINTEIWLLQE